MEFLDILYPKRCALCDRVVSGREYPVCLRCREEVKPITEPRCMRCSKPIDSAEKEFCLDCERHEFRFDCGFAVFLYCGKIKASIARFKYGGRQEYGRFYGEMLNLFAASYIADWKPEVLIPVPVHAAKLSKRGYNQAKVLADILGKTWGIPVDSRSVKRRKKTRAQKNLNPGERRRNLKEAFTLVKEVRYKTVVLVDDIYTTGSTIDALATLLKDHGVEKVYFLAACIGRGL